MNKLIKYISRVNHNYYAFISGVVITVSLDLFMSLFSENQLPDGWIILVFSSLITLVSSLFWSIIAWQLDSIQSLVYRDAPDFVDVNAIWDEVLITKLKILKRYYLIALLCLIVGLGFLPCRLILY